MRYVKQSVLLLSLLVLSGCERILFGDLDDYSSPVEREDATAKQCLDAMDCPDPENECLRRTCSSGRCIYPHVAEATPMQTQTFGDCKVNVCDGKGAAIQKNDDTDVPNDGQACTSDECTGGKPFHLPKIAGTLCGKNENNEPLVCNAEGQCVGCITGMDCPGTDDECSHRTCDAAGVCGVSFTAQGTLVAAQTENDCRLHVCDGLGHFVDIPDDTDVPLDDGNVCTMEACSLGVPEHPAVVDGSPCEDGDLCTPMDTCQMGACLAGLPLVCLAQDSCHLEGTCDPLTGVCSNPVATDGTMCFSNNATGACKMGTCFACGDGLLNGAESCDDGNQLANDGCNPSCGVEIGFSCSGTPSVCCSTTCQNNLACGPGELPLFFSSMPSLPIPDNKTGAIALINVSQMGLVRKIVPTINITHGNTGHLDIFLVSPYGVQRELTTGNGNGANFTATTFSDAAGASITAGSPPYTGTFRSQEPLSGITNQAANGAWVLRMSDDTPTMTGVLNSWSLGLCIDPNVTSVCGNGFVEANETCDDGNATSGDGCTNCQLEITCGPNQTLVVKRSTNTPQLIPDNNPAGITRAINIGNMGTVAKAIVVLHAISHQWANDLDISLTTPQGMNLNLSWDNGLDGDNYVSTIFDDSAATAITSGIAPFRGRYRPETAFSTICGQSSNGNWTLRISDDQISDVGMLTSWAIALCVAP